MTEKNLFHLRYYNIYQTLWEGRKHWIRAKIAISYLKVSKFKYLECVTSNYMNAGSVKEERDGYQERKYINKCFILFCVIYVNRNATYYNLRNYSKEVLQSQEIS